jgi:Cu-Zn family superoxide dismutase
MKWMNDHRIQTAACALSVGLLACQQQSEPTTGGETEVSKQSAEKTTVGEATVDLAGRSGSYLQGEVSLSAMDDGVQVTVEIEDAVAGEHGVHIHERADCSADDASSVGPVWNPDGNETGTARLGDLGNISVGAMGEGSASFTMPDVSLKSGGDRSIMGRSLVIHARPDGTQDKNPNDTRRVGCAEISNLTDSALSQR